MKVLLSTVLLAGSLIDQSVRARDDFPAGWLPFSRLDGKPNWPEFRRIEDRIHLYCPMAASRCADLYERVANRVPDTTIRESH